MKLMKLMLSTVAFSSLSGVTLADVAVTMQNVASCPFVASSTSVSNSGGVAFQFKFRWTVISFGSTYSTETDPTCCTLFDNALVSAPSTSPATIFTAHHLNPARNDAPGSGSPELYGELASVCPSFLSTGEIDMSWCDEKQTNINCVTMRQAPSAEPQNADLPRAPVGPDRLNTAEMVEKAQDPERPLLVAGGVIPDREGLIMSFRSSRQKGAVYRPLTNVKEVLETHGCSEVDALQLVSENGSRSATYVFDCAAGQVLAREAWQAGTRNAGVAPGAEPFAVRPEVSGVGQYLVDEAGLRQSTVSWWDKGVILNVSLQHLEGNRQDWVTAIARDTVLIDRAIGIR